MIITRQDLLTLASDDVELLKEVYSNPVDVVKELKENGKLEIFTFYDKLRHAYNDKKSKVYINIMKEVEDPKKVLTTLSALVTQILLFSEKSTNREIFLNHSKLSDILKALQSYSTTQNVDDGIGIIKEIKQDIKQVESF